MAGDPALAGAVERLCREPARTALLMDFDGTLMRFVFFASLMPAIAITGCGFNLAQQRQELLERVRPIAAFDLQCPANEIKVTNLSPEGESPSQAGVEGCGQRGRYIRTPGTHEWRLNSGGRSEAPTPAQ